MRYCLQRELRLDADDAADGRKHSSRSTATRINPTQVWIAPAPAVRHIEHRGAAVLLLHRPTVQLAHSGLVS
jgi:hypothetical protein